MIKKLPLITLFLTSILFYGQQSYYNDVDLTKVSTELKEELATKIIDTHTNYLSYTPGIWEACKATDVNPENSSEVLLIYGYTNDTSTTALTDGIDNQNTGGTTGWNREHTYPRSLGDPDLGSTGPGADAHHLRPSNATMNSNRGNLPFATGSGNAGSVSGGWYPGDEWKGDVARMMMYMYLRYGEQCLPSVVGVGSSSSTPDDMIDLFLDWNAEDPVSEIEEARNAYHENTLNDYAQGNRNPFIDNPYLATLIWGGTVAEDKWDMPTASSSEFKLTDGIKMYPNPSTNGSLNISITNNINISEIGIYSVIGKRVTQVTNPNFTNNRFSISNINKGIYLVKISSENNTITKKLIVQ